MNLKTAMDKLAESFAKEIIAAIRDSSLSDVWRIEKEAFKAMRTARGKKRGRKPGRKPAAKARRKPAKPTRKSRRSPAKASKRRSVARNPAKRGAKKTAKKAVLRTTKKGASRKPRTAPKCVFPGCTKNRYPKGGGYCSTHFRKHRKGEIPAPGKK